MKWASGSDWKTLSAVPEEFKTRSDEAFCCSGGVQSAIQWSFLLLRRSSTCDSMELFAAPEELKARSDGAFYCFGGVQSAIRWSFLLLLRSSKRDPMELFTAPEELKVRSDGAFYCSGGAQSAIRWRLISAPEKLPVVSRGLRRAPAIRLRSSLRGRRSAATCRPTTLAGDTNAELDVL